MPNETETTMPETKVLILVTIATLFVVGGAVLGVAGGFGDRAPKGLADAKPAPQPETHASRHG